ncbi:MAG: NUDIX domain-containing protein [Clostridia bacterium]|nr:NUDIX domain-containing protein [Clostridia bacterium]
MQTKTHEQYNKEKLEFAKHLVKENKFFRKARAIIVKNDKILVLHKIKTNTYQLPGGGINEKENARAATKREALEETNAIVKPVHYLGKYYYSAKIDYNNEHFISKRVEFVYICNFVKFCNAEKLGIDGEFNENVELCEIPFSQIKKISLPPKLKQKALEYLNLHYQR